MQTVRIYKYSTRINLQSGLHRGGPAEIGSVAEDKQSISPSRVVEHHDTPKKNSWLIRNCLLRRIPIGPEPSLPTGLN
jgi:hypothetical protein